MSDENSISRLIGEQPDGVQTKILLAKIGVPLDAGGSIDFIIEQGTEPEYLSIRRGRI